MSVAISSITSTAVRLPRRELDAAKQLKCTAARPRFADLIDVRASRRKAKPDGEPARHRATKLYIWQAGRGVNGHGATGARRSPPSRYDMPRFAMKKLCSLRCRRGRNRFPSQSLPTFRLVPPRRANIAPQGPRPGTTGLPGRFQVPQPPAAPRLGQGVTLACWRKSMDKNLVGLLAVAGALAIPAAADAAISVPPPASDPLAA